MAVNMTQPEPLGAEEEPVAEETTEEIDWQAKAEMAEKAAAEAQAALDLQQAEAERNTKRLQSSLQAQVNQEKQRARAEQEGWEDRFHKERMATMEETEALRYENALAKQKIEKANQERDQLRIAAQNAQSAASYVQHFTALGVSADRLNTRGNLQELADSGYAALEQQRSVERAELSEREAENERLRKELEAVRGPNADPNALATAQGDLQPPAVATHTPGANVGARTEEQALEAARQYFGGEKPTLEQLYSAVEHQRLPASVLPGLEGMPRDQ
jgi:hypothetical protein